MGATESTARSNETNEEEPRNNSSDGSSIGAATAIATAAAGVAFAAWGVSRMLSNNTDSQETEHHGMQQSLVNSPNITPAGGSTQRSTWSPPPPPPGGFKMKTAGACHPKYVGNTGVQRGPSGYGGILRDHNNAWVGGFMGFIGEYSDGLTSEFYGILKGLEILDKFKLKGAILETSSQAAYEWVTRRGDHHGKSEIVRASWPMITKCRQLADKNGIGIHLIPRADNKQADKLANMGIDSEEEYVEFKYPPDGLRSLVEKDAKFYGHGMQQSLVNSPNITPAGGSRQRGSFKMNTDGACHPKNVGNSDVQRGPSGYGGILRDHNNAWVVGFMGFIGEYSDGLTSEFYGILKGLELLDKRNMKGAILQTDSEPAHYWVTGETENPGKSEIIRECWNIIMKCRQLVEKNNIDIQPIGKADNKYAHKLANMATDRKQQYVEIKDLPNELKVING